MENEPRNYEEPPIKLLFVRFCKWYVAKWWNPLIPLSIFSIGFILLAFYSDANEIYITFFGFFSVLTSIAAVFTSFVHFLLEKRWLDFCLLLLTSIILVYVYLFLALSIAFARGAYF